MDQQNEAPMPRADYVDILKRIEVSVESLQKDYNCLSASVEAIKRQVDVLGDTKQLPAGIGERRAPDDLNPSSPTRALVTSRDLLDSNEVAALPRPSSSPSGQVYSSDKKPSSSAHASSASSSKIILTTYTGQSGIDPVALIWGQRDPVSRGPVVVSRTRSTFGRRNAIGAHGGSYSIYHALAVASKDLNVEHKPDFTNTEPAAKIGPFPQWSDPRKIVAMDPWGHLSPWLFTDLVRREHVDIRPSIAITKAHMKLPELEQSVRAGRLIPDGKICLNETGELAVTKFAVEPVWFLPGVAERFGIGTSC